MQSGAGSGRGDSLHAYKCPCLCRVARRSACCVAHKPRLDRFLVAARHTTCPKVYKAMVWKGLERSVITYSSLISACEKAGRWETALELFDEMLREGCAPNTVTYNSLITACGQGAQRGRGKRSGGNAAGVGSPGAS